MQRPNPKKGASDKNSLPAPQCRTSKPLDDTTDDLLSLARCSETGITVAALLLYFFLYIGLLEMTRTDGLMSSPKDTKVNLLLNFWGRAECTRKRNKSQLQVGLELYRPFDPQSSALTNRPDATPMLR